MLSSRRLRPATRLICRRNTEDSRMRELCKQKNHAEAHLNSNDQTQRFGIDNRIFGIVFACSCSLPCSPNCLPLRWTCLSSQRSSHLNPAVACSVCDFTCCKGMCNSCMHCIPEERVSGNRKGVLRICLVGVGVGGCCGAK